MKLGIGMIYLSVWAVQSGKKKKLKLSTNKKLIIDVFFGSSFN